MTEESQTCTWLLCKEISLIYIVKDMICSFEQRRYQDDATSLIYDIIRPSVPLKIDPLPVTTKKRPETSSLNLKWEREYAK